MMTDNELNALVAEKVMGLKNIRPYTGHEDLSREHICDEGVGAGFIYDRHYSDHGYEVCNVPDYCNDIAAAWEVVKELGTRGLSFGVINGGYTAVFSTGYLDADDPEGVGHSVPTSRAICLAALMAVGVEVK